MKSAAIAALFLCFHKKFLEKFFDAENYEEIPMFYGCRGKRMHLENRRMPFIPCRRGDTGVMDSMHLHAQH